MFRGQSTGDDGGRNRRIGGAADGPVGLIFKGLATGVGLASESYHHRKEKKVRSGEQKSAAGSTTEAGDPSNDTSAELPEQPVYELAHEEDMNMSRRMDESAWKLDEAQDEITQGQPPSYAVFERTGDEAQVVNSFLQNHPLPTSDTLYQLAVPVVLTQRRPGARTRGFVRAYAPILEGVGIDQPAFLEFLDNLNKAVEPSPWIQAINLASLAGNAVPEPFTMIISAAVKLAADTASEAHSRTKTNKFLDDMNQSYFAPRGLVALVMTWRPSKSGELMTNVDFTMNSSIAKASSQTQDRWWKNTQHKLSQSSGATSFEFPETAPLTFPVLDDLMTAEAEGPSETKKKQSAIKNGGAFVESYLDKRARAKWAGENPESKMATAAPKEEFYSRYADPNHPASSGDPIAFLTGGHLQGFRGRGGIESLRARGLGHRDSGSNSRGLGISREGGRGQAIRQRREEGRGLAAGNGLGGIGPLSLVQGAKKFLQDDVLYLMIVQRPTEEQLAASETLLASYQQRQR
ncbi:hypothetical protein SUNI508_08504 [Seiridium unicorne]|uniref:Uncharacterized protein n=1 Tax=Seiridium unicorne TaxID=138068 RepID=A0ABR2UTU0_9PEZI